MIFYFMQVDDMRPMMLVLTKESKYCNIVTGSVGKCFMQLRSRDLHLLVMPITDIGRFSFYTSR
jgi:hypothetical protein